MAPTLRPRTAPLTKRNPRPLQLKRYIPPPPRKSSLGYGWPLTYTLTTTHQPSTPDGAIIRKTRGPFKTTPARINRQFKWLVYSNLLRFPSLRGRKIKLVREGGRTGLFEKFEIETEGEGGFGCEIGVRRGDRFFNEESGYKTDSEFEV